MHHWFFVTTIFIFLVKGDKDHLFYFSRNKSILSECIENHLLSADSNYGNNGIAKIIADLIAKSFSGKSKTMKNLRQGVTSILFEFKHHKSDNAMRILEVNSKQLHDARKSACSDNNIFVAVPIFEGEPREIADVLDHMLVNWPDDLSRLIQSQDGRALLRGYANDALTAFECALRICSYNSNIFRLALRVLWIRRAQIFFDANDVQQPYFSHTYTSSTPRLHMIRDISVFLN